MSDLTDLLNQYRADFVRIADEVLRRHDDAKKAFAYVINDQIIRLLRERKDEGVICELRDEAFRIFDSRRAVFRNRQARKQQKTASPYKQVNKNKGIIRYAEPNEVPRANGVRRQP